MQDSGDVSSQGDSAALNNYIYILIGPSKKAVTHITTYHKSLYPHFRGSLRDDGKYFIVEKSFGNCC